MNLKSITAFAISFALAAAVAVPAFADDSHPKAVFPMPAAEFQQKVDSHLARGQARMEKRIADKNVDADKAKEMREHFDARAAKVRAAAAAAEQDGVVTADEAKAVREAGGGHGHCQKKDAKA